MKKTLLVLFVFMAYIGASWAAVEVDAYVDYSTYTEYPFYKMAGDKTIIDEAGELEINNDEAGLANWQVQYFVADQVPTTIGTDYKVTAMIKGSEAGSLNCNMGDWNNSTSATLAYTTEWQEVTIDLYGVPAESSFVVFQSGTLVGKLQIKWLKVTHESGGAELVYKDLITNGSFDGDDVTNFSATEQGIGTNPGKIVELDGERCLKVVSADNPANAWDTQLFITVDHVFTAGEKYKFSMKVKADKAASGDTQAHKQPGQYLFWNLFGAVKFTTEWTTIEKMGAISSDCAGMSTIAINLASFAEANAYYFDDIKFEYGTTDAPTSIATVNQEVAKSDVIYNLNGQRLNAVEGCGLYIVNGKKVLVK